MGDVKTTLMMLSDKLQGWSGVSPDYAIELEQCKQAWIAERQKICNVPKSDSMVVCAVNEVCHRINGVQCAAAGGLPGELHKLWLCNGKGDYHLEYGFSCMGYEVAGAVGLKMACPEKEVFAMVGDGSWLMLHTEIVSARKLGYPINVVLVDNCGFGCIHRLQTGSGIPKLKK